MAKEITKDVVMKNALIINGKVYRVKRISIITPVWDICSMCDLKRRCENNQNRFCAPFEKKGFVPYFVKMASDEQIH